MHVSQGRHENNSTEKMSFLSHEGHGKRADTLLHLKDGFYKLWEVKKGDAKWHFCVEKQRA